MNPEYVPRHNFACTIFVLVSLAVLLMCLLDKTGLFPRDNQITKRRYIHDPFVLWGPKYPRVYRHYQSDGAQRGCYLT